MAQFKPDVVFVMVGMNDCNKSKGIDIVRFKENLEKLVSLIKEVDGLPILQTTCPVLRGEPDSETYSLLPAYMDVIRQISSDKNIPLIDHFLFWTEYSVFHEKWMNNLIHPNAYGHRAFAKYLYQCFGIYDGSAPSSKLPLS